jgi:four helix bundle protein
MVNRELQKREDTTQRGRVDLPDRTFAFASRIVELCRLLDKSPGVSRTLSAQLFRSGTSIGANVEEAQAGPTS